MWIGYDDNRPAKLSGAGSALPVWGEMMAALAPEPLVLQKPDNIELVSIDVQTGLRGGSGCPGALELPFVKGSAPEARAPCAGDATIEAVEKAVDAVKETVAPLKSWLQRLFGK